MSLKFVIIPVTPYQQNCSLLICKNTHKAAIVDPGGDIDTILKVIKTEQAIPEVILVTHGHLDHVGGVVELAKKLSLPIEGPNQEDKFWLDALPSQLQSFGFPHSDSFTPNKWLNNGDIVSFGDQSLKVIHCPGHTPGHIVFFHQQSKLAIVGDVLFNGSIGRTDFPKGDFDTLINSIKNNLWPLGKDVKFISGHGPMSTFGQEMQTNPYVSIKNSESI